jgi:hypothetical protein
MTTAPTMYTIELMGPPSSPTGWPPSRVDGAVDRFDPVARATGPRPASCPPCRVPRCPLEYSKPDPAARRGARRGLSSVESRGWLGCGGGIPADVQAGTLRYLGPAPIDRVPSKRRPPAVARMSFECDAEAQPEQSGGFHPARPRSSACHSLTSGGTPGGEYGGAVAEPHGGCGPPVAAAANAGIVSMKRARRRAVSSSGPSICVVRRAYHPPSPHRGARGSTPHLSRRPAGRPTDVCIPCSLNPTGASSTRGPLTERRALAPGQATARPARLTLAFRGS